VLIRDSLYSFDITPDGIRPNFKVGRTYFIPIEQYPQLVDDGALVTEVSFTLAEAGATVPNALLINQSATPVPHNGVYWYLTNQASGRVERLVVKHSSAEVITCWQCQLESVGSF
jgi:hypothetical protein